MPTQASMILRSSTPSMPLARVSRSSWRANGQCHQTVSPTCWASGSRTVFFGDHFFLNFEVGGGYDYPEEYHFSSIGFEPDATADETEYDDVSSKSERCGRHGYADQGHETNEYEFIGPDRCAAATNDDLEPFLVKRYFDYLKGWKCADLIFHKWGDDVIFYDYDEEAQNFFDMSFG